MAQSPAASQKLSPGLKSTLELGPIALFLAIVSLGGRFGLEDTVQRFIVATAVLVPLSIVGLAIIWLRERKTPWMLLASTVLLTFFGVLTILTRSPEWLQLKVTLANGLFALVLGGAYAFAWPLLRALMGETLHAPDRLWRRATGILALGFALATALNEYMRLAWESFEAWAWGAKVGLPILGFAFMGWALYPIARANLKDDPAA